MTYPVKMTKCVPVLPLACLVYLSLTLQAPGALAFETPFLDQAIASYSLEAIDQVQARLGNRQTMYQKGEILSAKAMVLFADGDNTAAKRTALAAISALNKSIARGRSVIAAHFLLFKIYGQLSVLDWTYALQTQAHLNYLRIHAPGDRRTRMAEAMHALYAPSLLGGNQLWALKTMERLLAEKYEMETANLLAVAYEQTGRHTKARRLAEDSLRRNPTDRVAMGVVWRLQNTRSSR